MQFFVRSLGKYRHSFIGLLAVTTLALAGCGGGQSASATPIATLALPPQLAAYHIFVTDLVTGNVAELGVQTVHVSRSVHGLALSADKRSIYVTDIAGGRLDVFALQNGRLGTEHSVKVGSEPVHMVDTPDGKTVYVSNFASNTVSVVDTRTWKQTKTIPVAGHPFAMVLSPDAHYAYVACGSGPAVAVIDTTSNTVAATITLPQGTQPYGIGMSADGHYVYTSDNLGGQLFVIDTSTRTVLGTVKIGAKPALMVRSPDGATLYVSNGADHSISVLDLSQDAAHPTVTKTVLVLGYPHGIDVTPDGKYVVVAGTTGNAISLVDAKSLTNLTTNYGEQDPNDILVAG